MLLMEDVTEQVRLSEEVQRVERHLASVVESAQDIVLSTDHGRQDSDLEHRGGAALRLLPPRGPGT